MFYFPREIAGSIKHLLDAFNKVIAEIPGGESGSKQVYLNIVFSKHQRVA